MVVLKRINQCIVIASSLIASSLIWIHYIGTSDQFRIWCISILSIYRGFFCNNKEVLILNNMQVIEMPL